MTETEPEFDPHTESALAKLTLDEEAFKEDARLELGPGSAEVEWQDKEDKENADWVDDQGALPRSPGEYFRLYSESMKEPHFEGGETLPGEEDEVERFIDYEETALDDDGDIQDAGGDMCDDGRVLASFYVHRRGDSDTGVILREEGEDKGSKTRKRIQCGMLPFDVPTACALDLTNNADEDVGMHISIFSSSLFLSLLTEEDLIIPTGCTHRLVLQAQPSIPGKVSGNVVIGSALCTFEAEGVLASCEVDTANFDANGNLPFILSHRHNKGGDHIVDQELWIVNTSPIPIQTKCGIRKEPNSPFSLLGVESKRSNSVARDAHLIIPPQQRMVFVVRYQSSSVQSMCSETVTISVAPVPMQQACETNYTEVKSFQLAVAAPAPSRTRTVSPTTTVDLSDLLGCEVRSPEGNSRLFVNRWLSEGSLRMKLDKRTATATLKNRGSDNIVAQIALEGKNSSDFVVSPSLVSIPGDGREHFRLTRLDAAQVNSELAIRIAVEDKGEVNKRYRFPLHVSRDLAENERPVVTFDRPVVAMGGIATGQTGDSSLLIQMNNAPLPTTLHLKPVDSFQYSHKSITFAKVGDIFEVQVSMVRKEPGFYRSFLQLEGDIIRHGSPGIPIWGYCGKAVIDMENQRVSKDFVKVVFRNTGERAGYIQCPPNVSHTDQRKILGGGVVLPEGQHVALLVELWLLGLEETVVEWGDEIIRRRRRRVRRATQSSSPDKFDLVYEGETLNREKRDFNTFPLRESHFDDEIFQAQRSRLVVPVPVL